MDEGGEKGSIKPGIAGEAGKPRKTENPKRAWKSLTFDGFEQKHIDPRPGTSLVLHGRKVPWLLHHHHRLLARPVRRCLRRLVSFCPHLDFICAGHVHVQRRETPWVF